MLATAISFVTAKFIPGYNTLRERLAPQLSQWVQEKIDPQPEPYENETEAQQEAHITNLQIFIVLCTYSRGYAVQSGRTSETASTGALKFFTIKAASESYARQIGLHIVGQKLAMALRTGKALQRNDTEVQKYLCWMSLYCTSHQ